MPLANSAVACVYCPEGQKLECKVEPLTGDWGENSCDECQRFVHFKFLKKKILSPMSDGIGENPFMGGRMSGVQGMQTNRKLMRQQAS